MEKWELIPNISVGKIEFGMSRNDVHSLFDIDYKAFKKSKFSKNTTDDYGRFHVFYTVDDNVEAVEVFDGIEIFLNGKVIFPIRTRDIEEKIPGILNESGSFTHKEYSIGIEGGDDNAESILMGEKGYYE